MRRPKEDPNDVRDRERARRVAQGEQRRAGQSNAAGLTSDLRGVYGLRNMSMFGTQGTPMGGSSGGSYGGSK